MGMPALEKGLEQYNTRELLDELKRRNIEEYVKAESDLEAKEKARLDRDAEDMKK